MPATDPDPDPENYSIDDMMDRLRARGEKGAEDQAELVTREDGTQVYRQRKRKRRSHQPKKEKEKRQRRFRVIQVVLAVALVAGAGLALLGSVIYLNSAAYQAKILERIRVWTGAEPRFTQFSVSPVSAGAASAELTWPEGSMLEHLKVNGVRADLRIISLIGGTWKGAEMLASHGGILKLRKPSFPPSAGQPRSGECPFDFRYRVPGFSVIMGSSDLPAARIHDTEASLVVLDQGIANLQLEGGALRVDGWGEFGLTFASLQFEDGGIRVGNLRLAPAPRSKGTIEISNSDQATLDLEGGETVLGLRLKQVPLPALLGPSFGSWLSAVIETPEDSAGGNLTFQSGTNYRLAARVPFRASPSSETRIRSLPMFGIIAREIAEVSYQNLRFDAEAQGVVVRDGQISGVEDLRFESRGRLSVTGKVLADRAGSLDGTLEVGLPDAAVNDASAAMRAVFKRRDGAYSWASVKVFGTGDKPLDDLQQQLDDASTLTSPASGGTDSLEDAFRELTTPDER